MRPGFTHDRMLHTPHTVPAGGLCSVYVRHTLGWSERSNTGKRTHSIQHRLPATLSDEWICSAQIISIGRPLPRDLYTYVYQRWSRRFG